MKRKYVYALDLSLNSTGICIFTNDGKLVKSLTIDTHALGETKLKLKEIGKTFIALMKEYPPDVIAIEQGFTLYNNSTQMVFRVHGLVNYIFCEYDQFYYPATTVKKTVGGRGNMTKDEMREVIFNKYPGILLQIGGYDESDAFAVGLTYFIKEGIIKNA